MIEINQVQIFGWESAIRSMRNPLESWGRSDSRFDAEQPIIGKNDKDLMTRLAKAGPDHRKFMRMINVSFDMTAHHVFWAEFDTYKVGTVRNSCSKMHKIHVKPFDETCFSMEGITEVGGMVQKTFLSIIGTLEFLRTKFNETQDKKYWRALIEMLPMGYNLKATVQLNYEVLRNIYHARKNHKLDEWKDFCKWVETLPLAEELITQ